MTRLRGFANLTKERRREIARMGGRAVPNDRRSFSQNSATAKASGGKGGGDIVLAVPLDSAAEPEL